MITSSHQLSVILAITEESRECNTGLCNEPHCRKSGNHFWC